MVVMRQTIPDQGGPWRAFHLLDKAAISILEQPFLVLSQCFSQHLSSVAWSMAALLSTSSHLKIPPCMLRHNFFSLGLTTGLGSLLSHGRAVVLLSHALPLRQVAVPSRPPVVCSVLLSSLSASLKQVGPLTRPGPSSLPAIPQPHRC